MGTSLIWQSVSGPDDDPVTPGILRESWYGMKRRSEINLFEMLKEPEVRERGDERSATESHLYGERRFSDQSPPPEHGSADAAEELFRRFPGRKGRGPFRKKDSSPLPRSTSADLTEEQSLSAEGQSAVAEIEPPAPPVAVGHWTTWGNIVVSMRRVTAVVIAVGWLLTLYVAFTAGRSGGAPRRDNIAAITAWTDSPAWAPVPPRFTKEVIRNRDSDTELVENGGAKATAAKKEATAKQGSAARTSSGRPIPSSDGSFYVSIAEARGVEAGPLFEPLLVYLDEKLAAAQAPLGSVDLLYKKQEERYRVVLGYFETRADAEAWVATVRSIPSFGRQGFENVLVRENETYSKKHRQP